MNETQHPRRLGRSISAVVAGILTGVILSIGTDAVLHATHLFPPMGQRMSDALFVLATAYRIVYAIVASYIIARLAPDRPMQHALVGGALGFVVSAVGTVVTWNKGPEFGPHWYPIALVVTAIPCAWVGAKLRINQLQP